MISLTEHNLTRRIGPILGVLGDGDVALVTDAGTPAISDPGYQVVEAALRAGYTVRPIPGPSAVIAALSFSGLPATPFTFLGYAPRTAGETARWVDQWRSSGQTVVFFDAPGRVARTVAAIKDADETIDLVICRELTKLFEQVVRGTAAEIMTCFADGTIPQKGEFVIVARSGGASSGIEVDELLRDQLAGGERPNQAAKSVAAATGLSKSDLYKRALELRSEDQSG